MAALPHQEFCCGETGAHSGGGPAGWKRLPRPLGLGGVCGVMGPLWGEKVAGATKKIPEELGLFARLCPNL